MGGLAAAHELAERGFNVTVYEREALGGKARSIGVPGTAEDGRRALPGEHGFRFFPGFYHHVPDTMRRIPYPGNPNGVWDNLVATSEQKASRTNGRAEGQLFGAIPDPQEAFTVDGLRRILVEEIVKHRGIPPHEAEYFTERLLVFFTSCEERRFGEWEYESWWDFISAERMSAEYRKCLGRGVTTELVASKPTVASTRTIGHMGEAILMNLMGRGNDGEFDRVLNAPTNEAWIRPWVRLLRKLGFASKSVRRSRSSRCATAESPRRGYATARGEGGGSRPTGSSARCRSSERAASGQPTCSTSIPAWRRWTGCPWTG